MFLNYVQAAEKPPAGAARGPPEAADGCGVAAGPPRAKDCGGRRGATGEPPKGVRGCYSYIDIYRGNHDMITLLISHFHDTVDPDLLDIFIDEALMLVMPLLKDPDAMSEECATEADMMAPWVFRDYKSLTKIAWCCAPMGGSVPLKKANKAAKAAKACAKKPSKGGKDELVKKKTKAKAKPAAKAIAPDKKKLQELADAVVETTVEHHGEMREKLFGDCLRQAVWEPVECLNRKDIIWSEMRKAVRQAWIFLWTKTITVAGEEPGRRVMGNMNM